MHLKGAHSPTDVSIREEEHVAGHQLSALHSARSAGCICGLGWEGGASSRAFAVRITPAFAFSALSLCVYFHFFLARSRNGEDLDSHPVLL